VEVMGKLSSIILLAVIKNNSSNFQNADLLIYPGGI